jgi:hypothetical protein
VALLQFSLSGEVSAPQTNAGSSAIFSSLVLRGYLNNNAISADAGDLVLMKRASIGEIDLVPPPDPSSVAPPVDTTVATSIATSTEFLYIGSNPIQTGVVPGTIEIRRAAVLRGRVLTREGANLSGVKISILSHPEFGSTMSRADGMFDMAVNGGGLLTVNYEKTGYLTAQRQAQTPWQDYEWLPDVVMIQADTAVTTIDLSSSAHIQVARGSQVNDSDGIRQATLLFPQSVQATMTLPDGTTQPPMMIRTACCSTERRTILIQPTESCSARPMAARLLLTSTM